MAPAARKPAGAFFLSASRAEDPHPKSVALQVIDLLMQISRRERMLFQPAAGEPQDQGARRSR